MKGKIRYELIILYDRFNQKPKDAIAMGIPKSPAYNYSRITKLAQIKAKELMDNKGKEIKTV